MNRYLRYVIRNLEPVRIADYSTSQSGQTDTLRFIPGSAVRGFVISSFAGRKDFEECKAELFSEERHYLNAYLTTKDHMLIPSPKGFYEDKTQTVPGEAKKIANVVINGAFEEGLKRAGLGRYCYIEDGCIHYYQVATGSDMKIRINGETGADQSVFRSKYLSEGQSFEGYIRLTGAAVEKEIVDLFAVGKSVRLGNARSQSLGNCKVVLSEVTENLPYLEAGFEAEKDCYMLLLSDTGMRSGTGELCGLSFEEIGKKLGVEDLRVEYASTSARIVSGYNRTWGTRVPSMTVYEAGSVFHLTFNGRLSEKAMKEAVDGGFGERKTEGFGRVLFLKDYEKVERKLACTCGIEDWGETKRIRVLSAEERKTLLIAAGGYYRNTIEAAIERYIIEHKVSKGNLNNSQLGTVRSILTKFRYVPMEAQESIRDYFGHALEKENKMNQQKEKASVNPLQKQIIGLFETPLEETLFGGKEFPFKVKGQVMGIPVKEFFSSEEEEHYKLELMVKLLGFRGSREKGV